jgi:hypothetical protein
VLGSSTAAVSPGTEERERVDGHSLDMNRDANKQGSSGAKDYAMRSTYDLFERPDDAYPAIDCNSASEGPMFPCNFDECSADSFLPGIHCGNVSQAQGSGLVLTDDSLFFGRLREIGQDGTRPPSTS